MDGREDGEGEYTVDLVETLFILFGPGLIYVGCVALGYAFCVVLFSRGGSGGGGGVAPEWGYSGYFYRFGRQDVYVDFCSVGVPNFLRGGNGAAPLP